MPPKKKTTTTASKKKKKTDAVFKYYYPTEWEVAKKVRITKWRGFIVYPQNIDQAVFNLRCLFYHDEVWNGRSINGTSLMIKGSKNDGDPVFTSEASFPEVLVALQRPVSENDFTEEDVKYWTQFIKPEWKWAIATSDSAVAAAVAVAGLPAVLISRKAVHGGAASADSEPEESTSSSSSTHHASSSASSSSSSTTLPLHDTEEEEKEKEINSDGDHDYNAETPPASPPRSSAVSSGSSSSSSSHPSVYPDLAAAPRPSSGSSGSSSSSSSGLVEAGHDHESLRHRPPPASTSHRSFWSWSSSSSAQPTNKPSPAPIVVEQEKKKVERRPSTPGTPTAMTPRSQNKKLVEEITELKLDDPKKIKQVRDVLKEATEEVKKNKSWGSTLMGLAGWAMKKVTGLGGSSDNGDPLIDQEVDNIVKILTNEKVELNVRFQALAKLIVDLRKDRDLARVNNAKLVDQLHEAEERTDKKQPTSKMTPKEVEQWKALVHRTRLEGLLQFAALQN